MTRTKPSALRWPRLYNSQTTQVKRAGSQATIHGRGDRSNRRRAASGRLQEGLGRLQISTLACTRIANHLLPILTESIQALHYFVSNSLQSARWRRRDFISLRSEVMRPFLMESQSVIFDLRRA